MDVGRMDVDDGTLGDLDESVFTADGGSQTMQWKLAAFDMPAKMECIDMIAFFEPIKLKGIELEVKYEKWSVVEVSFRTEADMKLALEKYNHKHFRGCRVTLKRPDEVTEELRKTEMHWQFLPLHVKDEIFQLLAPVRWGRIFTRVCKSWKKSLMSGRRSYPAGIFIDSGPQLETTSGSQSCPEYLTRTANQDITHLVLIRPHLHTCYGSIFRVNRRIKHLTIVKGNYFRVYMDNLWKYVDTITLIDTIVRVAVPKQYEDGCWTLALLVPRLQVTMSDHECSKDRPTKFARRLIEALYSSDLWWPYPREQTKWLRTALAQVSKYGGKYHKQEILQYLKNRNCLVYRIDDEYSTISKAGKMSSVSGASTDIEFETYALDKRDCAFIGMYVAHHARYGEARIEKPPCKWRNRHFEVENLCECQPRPGSCETEKSSYCRCEPADWEVCFREIRSWNGGSK